MNRIHGALVALILVLTACGSAESSFRQELSELGFSDETADCLIEELDSRGLGVEDITDDAITGGLPDGADEAIDACLNPIVGDLSNADDASRVVDDPADPASGDDRPDTDAETDIMTRDLTVFEQAFIDGAMEEGGSEETARCVLGELMDRDVDLMDLALSDPNDLPQDLLISAVFACGDELLADGAFDFAPTTGADDYGDDPELDALWDKCADGDGEACDELYFTSPFGSVYEDFGNTCGGAVPEGTFLCADEI